MRPSSLGALLGVVASCSALAVAGCNDPVADVRIDQLGPEVEGVEPGPEHRPGQPCVLCHGAYGGADPEMSIGGTIFQSQTTGDQLGTPAPNVEITLVDAFGNSPPTRVVTNAAGNFWIPKETWDPGFPLHAEITCSNGKRIMNSWIGRDGSCARCHYGSPNQGTPGWVVCN